MSNVIETLRQYLPSALAEDDVIFYYTIILILIIPACVFIQAPYGRFSGNWTKKFTFNGKYSWFVMEIVSACVLLYTTGLSLVSTQWLLAGLWLIHYCNRAIIHPIRAPSMAPIHLTVMLSAVLFNGVNGYTNGVWLRDHAVPFSVHLWIGIVLWAIGFTLNIYHDTLLFQLRQQGKGYFIPHGGLFEYVSCANYLSELIEWTGYAIAAWPSAPALLFVAATAANLMPRARHTHRWYQQKFEDYPRNRTAIIPYLF
ncbi:hypothetical protein EC973_004398 [Apophysomyces ossiformis]|uniref:3-oxo-5-alpha-steroid 4-dehydrogenase C-terminal domain-containing protein n=1 Tax=Apophysomyces ossiformis TaxID=679940 RepID=A0A8H7BSX6_9FUNG|nr:hypothetical protein EC973_004398 [Apophysomyces ossiformis]